MKRPAFLAINAPVGTGLNQPATLTSDAVSEDLIHDLRQPLGVIETLAYYLELTSEDDKITAHARQIQAMVSKANRILSTASASSAAKVAPAVLSRSSAS